MLKKIEHMFPCNYILNNIFPFVKGGKPAYVPKLILLHHTFYTAIKSFPPRAGGAHPPLAVPKVSLRLEATKSVLLHRTYASSFNSFPLRRRVPCYFIRSDKVTKALLRGAIGKY